MLGGVKMENKEFVSSAKMSGKLIGNWLAWGISVGLIYTFIYNAITMSMDSLILKSIVSIVLQGVLAILLWKLSTMSSFKKSTISYNDIPAVMRNLIIFTIVICIFFVIYNIIRFNSSMDQAVNSNWQLQYKEKVLSKLYSSEQMAEYNKEKEKIISEVKGKFTSSLILLEIGLTAVYLAVLPLEKKELIKYVG